MTSTLNAALLAARTEFGFDAQLVLGNADDNSGFTTHPILLKNTHSAAAVAVGCIHAGEICIYPPIALRANEMLVALEKKVALNKSMNGAVTTQSLVLFVSDTCFSIRMRTDVFDSETSLYNLDDIYLSLGVSQ